MGVVTILLASKNYFNFMGVVTILLASKNYFTILGVLIILTAPKNYFTILVYSTLIFFDQNSLIDDVKAYYYILH